MKRQANPPVPVHTDKNYGQASACGSMCTCASMHSSAFLCASVCAHACVCMHVCIFPIFNCTRPMYVCMLASNLVYVVHVVHVCARVCVCVFARVRAALSLPATGASKPLKLRTSCRYSAALCATSCWPWLCIRATWPRPDVTRAPGASSAPNDMDACVRMCACVYVHVYVPARVCHLEGSGRLFNRSGAGRGPAPSTGRQHCPAHRLPANTRTVLQHRLLE